MPVFAIIYIMIFWTTPPITPLSHANFGYSPNILSFSSRINWRGSILNVSKVLDSEYLCEVCIEGVEEDKKELVRIHNCNVLKSKIDIGTTGDDSYDDPEYLEKGKGASASGSETSFDGDTYEFSDGDAFNPFEKESSDGSSVFNPFESNISQTLPSVCSDGPQNSSEAFNPFCVSSPKKTLELKGSQNCCPYCDKQFPSNYNMKQHQISIHKILPPDMKIFKCAFKNCTFVTGSRVGFGRHRHERSSQIESKLSKPSCPACHKQFFNTSSLKRHMIRKKHLI